MAQTGAVTALSSSAAGRGLAPGPQPLERLEPGTLLVVGGDRAVVVDEALAAAFGPGDRLLMTSGGTPLHVPATVAATAAAAVGRASDAFRLLGAVPDDAVTAFFAGFAERLADDDLFAPVAEANRHDVARARERGRSTTRLVLDDRMRAAMVEGLRVWERTASGRDRLLDAVQHPGWRLELRSAGLGVVAFVFEGRPNVLADACGVLRGGNTVVLRIGSDALSTARALVSAALEPALVAAGLPAGAVSLVDAAERAAGWALFADRRLSLAVARGSGTAVAQLGDVARSVGTPVSLHGTGGGWVVAGRAADADALAQVVEASLDRKVCNTLNVCVLPAARAAELAPAVLRGLEAAAARRGAAAKLHVGPGAEDVVPRDWFERRVGVARAAGVVEEPQAEPLPLEGLAAEWEWEDSPEITLAVAEDLAEAVTWFGTWSPRLVASLVSEDAVEHEVFWAGVDAPFVGNGTTRWVDGQYALGRPELGLSSWSDGRLLARGGVLTGDGVHTVRARAVQDSPDLRR